MQESCRDRPGWWWWWRRGGATAADPIVPQSERDDYGIARWDAWQQNKHEHIRRLPPAGPPVYCKWDEHDDTLYERLLAALDRDGVVILTEAVPPPLCDQIMFDMEPYVACAFERTESRRPRNGNQRSVRADALPSRSDASWPIARHPALMAISDAVLGRQVRRAIPRRHPI